MGVADDMIADAARNLPAWLSLAFAAPLYSALLRNERRMRMLSQQFGSIAFDRSGASIAEKARASAEARRSKASEEEKLHAEEEAASVTVAEDQHSLSVWKGRGGDGLHLARCRELREEAEVLEALARNVDQAATYRLTLAEVVVLGY